jgi:predicted ABC-type ATPase
MLAKESIDFIEEKFLGHVVSQDHPTLYATCGIPGAGKSTFVDHKLANREFPSDAFILNPDRVMIALPEYQKDCEALGAQKAYQKWEMPARELAYAMADRVGEMRGNIIKDMGCANPLSLELVKNLKANGYKIFMYHILCGVHEAFKRIDQRDFQIDRDEVRARDALLNTLLPEYKRIADTFYAFDNSNLQNPFQIAA